jgi:hypothetical protein
VAVEEPVERKRGPRFFSNIGKNEKSEGQQEATSRAARMARALRGKSVEAPQESIKEKRSAPAAPRAGVAPTRPRSGFKMRYIWGMMLYLLIADFLGIWITNWMVANHLDALMFTAGPIKASRSTLIFLALLIIILVVMARFDLIPRSLGAMSNTPGSTRAGTQAARGGSAATFENRAAQPTMKQGVKGEHDDLYQEYRENQRYFQKRDRKR